MTVVRWLFEDLTTATPATYTFEINPNEGGSLAYEKSIVTQTTSAFDGQVIVQEGQDKPLSSSFSGTILTEEGHDAMVDWFQRRHQIRVTDDLGRQMMIYITKFTPKRVRSALYPWKHTYTVDYIVLDVES